LGAAIQEKHSAEEHQPTHVFEQTSQEEVVARLEEPAPNHETTPAREEERPIPPVQETLIAKQAAPPPPDPADAEARTARSPIPTDSQEPPVEQASHEENTTADIPSQPTTSVEGVPAKDPGVARAQERDQQFSEREPSTPGLVAKAAPPTRLDFGWLTQALWRKVEQLKRYPHRARLNRWQGTVVVRAVIKQDGSFADLIMEKSSGHEVLDQDALELLWKASPLALKQELGRSEVTIRIPISYKLE
jgi:protein TonB